MKGAFNSLYSLLNAQVGDEYKTNVTLEMDPLKEALLSTQSSLKRGQLSEAHKNLDKLLRIS